MNLRATGIGVSPSAGGARIMRGRGGGQTVILEFERGRGKGGGSMYRDAGSEIFVYQY